jgi:hypothetical protein
VAKAPLASVLETIIATHAPRAHGSEVAWALWGALAWNIKLDASVAKTVSAMDDDVVALLALEASQQSLFPPGSLDLHLWQTLVLAPGALQADHWLLAYEAHRQGWLSVPEMNTHRVFRPMADAGVNFFDRAQNVPQFPLAAGPIPGGDLEDFYA